NEEEERQERRKTARRQVHAPSISPPARRARAPPVHRVDVVQTPTARHALVTAAVAAALALVLPGPPTRAQELADGAQRAGEPSWGDYTSPARRRGRQLRRQGLVKLLDAQQASPDSLGPPPEVLFDQALLRFDRALRDLPDDPDLLYF